MEYIVQRGDSLWQLACRDLGNGNRWREIHDFHNQEVARRGFHQKSLMPIKDPNLIFAGQTLFVPSPQRQVQPPTPQPPITTVKPDKPARGFDMKTHLVFDDANNPTHYRYPTPHFTMEGKMTGVVAVENLSVDRDRHNFELAMEMDGNKLSIEQKMAFNDSVIRDLTVGLKMDFDPVTKKVYLQAPIAQKANLGPFEVEAGFKTPTQFLASIKPQPFSATVNTTTRKYRFEADIKFTIDITLHPTPVNAPSTKSQRVSNKDLAFRDENSTSRHVNLAKNINDFCVGVTLILIGTLAFQYRLAMATSSVSMPYMYNISPYGRGYQTPPEA